jgi:hypothetical protein
MSTMTLLGQPPEQGGQISWVTQLAPTWRQCKTRFLVLAPAQLRDQVAATILEPDMRGRGLRMWLRRLAVEQVWPRHALPAALIQVYLDDPEAMPLHNCTVCDVAIPIRPDYREFDDVPQKLYFPECPCCGGPTGLQR